MFLAHFFSCKCDSRRSGRKSRWPYRRMSDRVTARKAALVNTILDEYQRSYKGTVRTPTVVSGHGQRESRLLAPPFYDV